MRWLLVLPVCLTALAPVTARAQAPVAPATPAPHTYQPTPNAHKAREVVAVVLGSSECPFSTWADYTKVVDPMLRALQEQAADRGLRFTAIGIAIDQRPDSGVAYLRRVASFDEVLVGRGWINSGLAYYFPPDRFATTSTPSLVILEREYSDGVEAPRMLSVRPLFAAAGVDSIRAFAQRGAPIAALLGR